MADMTTYGIKVTEEGTDQAKSKLERLIGTLEGVEAALSDLADALDKTGDEQEETAKKTDRLGGSLGKLKGVAAALGGAFVVKQFFDLGKSAVIAAGEVEALGVRMNSVMGSDSAGAAATSWITDFAAKTPYQIETVSKAFMQLKMAGLDPTAGSLVDLGDAVAKAGGTVQQMDSAFRAISKSMMRGKIGAEEMNMLIDAQIDGWGALSRAMGVSVQDLMDMSQAGQLGRKEIKLLIDQLGKESEGAMEDLSGTFVGLISTLQDNWKLALAEMAEGGLLDGVKQAVTKLIDTIAILKETGQLEEWGNNIGQVAGAVIDTFAWVATEMPLYIEIGSLAVVQAFVKMQLKINEVLGKIAQVIQEKFIDPFRTLVYSFGTDQMIEAMEKLNGVAQELTLGNLARESEDLKILLAELQTEIDGAAESLVALDVGSAGAEEGIGEINDTLEDTPEVARNAEYAINALLEKVNASLKKNWKPLKPELDGYGILPPLDPSKVTDDYMTTSLQLTKMQEWMLEDMAERELEIAQGTAAQRLLIEREYQKKAAAEWERLNDSVARGVSNLLADAVYLGFTGRLDEVEEAIFGFIDGLAGQMAGQFSDTLMAAFQTGDFSSFQFGMRDTLDAEGNVTGQSFSMGAGWAQLGMAIGFGMMQQGIAEENKTQAIGGGILGGAGMGASVGGPWGALVGAIIGGAMAWNQTDPNANRYLDPLGLHEQRGAIGFLADPLGLFDREEEIRTRVALAGLGGQTANYGSLPRQGWDTRLYGGFNEYGTPGFQGRGVLQTQGQDLSDEQFNTFFQTLESITRRTAGAFRTALEAFGDADLFALVQHWEGIPLTEFEDTMSNIITTLANFTIPDELTATYADAFAAGLGNLGMSAEQITVLMRELSSLPFDERMASLTKVIEVLKRTRELMNFDIEAELDKTPSERFGDFMEEAQEQVEILSAGWENLSLADRAVQLEQIGSIWETVLNTAMQQLQQIESIRAGLERSFGGAIESLQLSQMDPNERRAYFESKIADLVAQLEAATDPGEIQDLSNNILGYIQALGQLGTELGPDLDAVANLLSSGEALLEAMDFSAVMAEVGSTAGDTWHETMSGMLEDVNSMLEDGITMDEAQQAYDLINQARQMEIEYLRQLRDLQDEITGRIASQRERLQYEGMDRGERQDYYQEQIAGLFSRLNSQDVLSPEEIAETEAELERYLQMYEDWLRDFNEDGSLTDSQRENLLGWWDYLEEAVNRAIGRSEDEVEDINGDYVTALEAVNTALADFASGLEATDPGQWVDDMIALLESVLATANAGLDSARQDVLDSLAAFEEQALAARTGLADLTMTMDDTVPIIRDFQEAITGASDVLLEWLEDNPDEQPGGGDGRPPDRPGDGGPDDGGPDIWSDTPWVVRDDVGTPGWYTGGKSLVPGGDDDPYITAQERLSSALEQTLALGADDRLIEGQDRMNGILQQILARLGQPPVVNVSISGGIAALRPMVRAIVNEANGTHNVTQQSPSGIF